jgi:translation initiation factor 2 beta subunit (eIF-2beta)/eIF-5
MTIHQVQEYIETYKQIQNVNNIITKFCTKCVLYFMKVSTFIHY